MRFLVHGYHRAALQVNDFDAFSTPRQHRRFAAVQEVVKSGFSPRTTAVRCQPDERVPEQKERVYSLLDEVNGGDLIEMLQYDFVANEILRQQNVLVEKAVVVHRSPAPPVGDEVRMRLGKRVRIRPVFRAVVQAGGLARRCLIKTDNLFFR